ncbi:50S ribosomal protein L35ae [Candidatus Micrarchaeota archaeon]|jgi:large subunit ribosomal protein L35Ae|nr:50S ribosomal protein L35ae [Candidatus Micrarchaeota archaeon]
MKGKIINYRRGRKTEYTDQFVIEIDGIESKEKASTLTGKRVVWKTSTGKEIIGKVTKAHGNKGAVLAKFNKGLPGQAVGTNVDVQA